MRLAALALTSRAPELVLLDMCMPGSVPTNCRQYEAPLPVRVISFRQLWYVGQVCLRCRLTGWTLGAYDTSDVAQHALAHFFVSRLTGR